MTPTRTAKSWKPILAAICTMFLMTALFQPVFGQAGTPLKYGQPATGALGPSQKADYTFDGKTGDKLTIDMTVINGEIDPMISLFDPQGRLIGENDNGGGKSNAHLEGTVLPSDGIYQLAGANVRKTGSCQFSLIILRETAKGAIYFWEKTDGAEKN